MVAVVVVEQRGGASDEEEGVRSSTGRKFGKTRTVARARAEEQKTGQGSSASAHWTANVCHLHVLAYQFHLGM